MTVKELIEELQQIENKDLPVFVYNTKQGELNDITLINTDISYRVDINI